jgi:hypothetical protein
MKSFLYSFSARYENLLGIRYKTFYEIFHYLEKRDRQSYGIVKTGMSRIAGNYSGDGMSTLLFDEFVTNMVVGIVC